MSNQSNPLMPTWNGYVASTLDALVLIQGAFEGVLTHVPRRPHDRERQDLIKSGSIFIYEEHASGIKRWTDGVSWSPSRILGNFLIYRELDKPFAPGEKKRALKKKRSSPAGGISKHDSASRTGSNVTNYTSTGLDIGKDTERSLIGSLTDSYEFKASGLVKKTISITHRGVPHHLVSYYSVDDVMSGRLITPSKDPQLRGVVPHMDLMTAQNFRSPIDELEYGVDGERTPDVFRPDELVNVRSNGLADAATPAIVVDAFYDVVSDVVVNTAVDAVFDAVFDPPVPTVFDSPIPVVVDDIACAATDVRATCNWQLRMDARVGGFRWVLGRASRHHGEGGLPMLAL
ncbi:Global transcription regulator sge1 [Tolypocladium ophioglossoides CBS 100239]|uniref:Global transcription regulator sge1 n=1 Tax=Tolypocladium ophioglossoides (strain CBS 100239) TaxID=1163406 RepID=A0A0L0NBU4_TOLOC|nr:Global transcription regulator sge1 [Tolypocladium ophioglossoides CBS 100239]